MARSGMSRSRRPMAISVFSGAGGLDLGLERAGFDIVATLDNDVVRCKTLMANRPRWSVTNADIRTITGRDVLGVAGLSRADISLVVGGACCQPFSKSAFWVPGRLRSIQRDARTALLADFARIVAELKPRAFLMENVAGLAYRTSRPVLDSLVRKLRRAGYRTYWQVLDAASYGVPQTRKRLFIAGLRGPEPFTFPPATFEDPESAAGGVRRPWVTAGDAIGDLDNGIVRPGETVRGKWGGLLNMIPPGSNYLHLARPRGRRKPIFRWRSRYWTFLLKLSPDRPSWTIQSSPGTHTGPFHWRSRRLRIEEVKRLQTFPDDWKFMGTEREQWAQIGDAVPPLLAQVIGNSLLTQAFPHARRPGSSRVDYAFRTKFTRPRRSR